MSGSMFRETYLFAPADLEQMTMSHRDNYTNQTEVKWPGARLSSSFNFFQPIVAVFQTVYAGITLYRTRGDQLDRFSFAAFELTVAPYLVMSVASLASQ